MDKQKPSTYTGRFGDSSQARRSQPSGSYHKAPRQSEEVRRPSGFGTAGQASKSKQDPEPETKKKGLRLKLFKGKKEKKEKPPKVEKTFRESEPGKNRPVLRALLAVVGAILILLVLMVLIFGGEDKTHHQMPVIERESIADFNPDETPTPGLEEA